MTQRCRLTGSLYTTRGTQRRLGSNSSPCWGSNAYGQAAAPKGSFKSIAAGDYNSCGVRADGTVTCWGYTDTLGRWTPAQGAFTAISAGSFHACGVRTDGLVACWGHNMGGEASPPGGTFSAVSAGGYGSCGIRPDDELVCWGLSGYEQ